jgi:uncharacterized coiled-coil protein SlyX
MQEAFVRRQHGGITVGKGELLGFGTVIGPKNVDWYGNSSPIAGIRNDAQTVAQRQQNPLSARVEKRISDLRVDIAGLERQISMLNKSIADTTATMLRSKEELSSILRQHGLPCNNDAAVRASNVVETVKGKTTRNQRRRRVKEKMLRLKLATEK